LQRAGYGFGPVEIRAYQNFVTTMSVEDRAEIFFLAANDKLFKPNLNSVGSSILTNLYSRDKQVCKFTDVPLDDN